jgi:MFS family permease
MPGPVISPFAALRHRNFRLFYTGQTLSLAGTWMQNLAQGWLILELTDSAFWVGFVSFLGSAGVLLFSLPAGVYVDRADRRRVVTVCQALLMVQALALWALVAGDLVRPWHVAAVATTVGLINAVEIPARQSFIVELVGRDDLTNAIALNSSAFNATRIVGPAIAGVLVASVGLAVCFLLNAISYGAVLLGLFRIRLDPVPRPAPAVHAGERLLEGLGFIAADRRVLGLVAATAVLSVLAFPFVALLPVFARDVLKVGVEGLGAMSSIVGIGALASALGLAALSPRVPRGRLVTWAGPLFGLVVAAFAYAPGLGPALAALGAAGFAMVLNNACTNTLLQGLVPDELRGRVMSVWTFAFVGLSPLGALLLGWVASLIGAPAATALGGVAASLAVTWIWRRFAREVTQLR